MGIEPTWDWLKPHTGFEDQERHQAASHLRWRCPCARLRCLFSLCLSGMYHDPARKSNLHNQNVLTRRQINPVGYGIPTPTQKRAKWQDELGQHHAPSKDAMDHHTLALAVMAQGVNSQIAQGNGRSGLAGAGSQPTARASSGFGRRTLAAKTQSHIGMWTCRTGLDNPNVLGRSGKGVWRRDLWLESEARGNISVAGVVEGDCNAAETLDYKKCAATLALCVGSSQTHVTGSRRDTARACKQ